MTVLVAVVLASSAAVAAAVVAAGDCSLCGNNGDDPTSRNCHSPLSMVSSRDQTSPRMVYPICVT